MRSKQRVFALAILIGAASCTGPKNLAALKSPISKSPAQSSRPCTCAAPPPATYVVFFDAGKFSLRPKSIVLIHLVAADDTKLSFGHITIVGNIDTAEASDGDTTLSLERALAVRNQLIADGVVPAKIKVQSNGSSHLLISTGPDVASQNNRNVMIEGDKVRY